LDASLVLGLLRLALWPPATLPSVIVVDRGWWRLLVG
jgi:hypothetical protein